MRGLFAGKPGSSAPIQSYPPQPTHQIIYFENPYGTKVTDEGSHPFDQAITAVELQFTIQPPLPVSSKLWHQLMSLISTTPPH